MELRRRVEPRSAVTTITRPLRHRATTSTGAVVDDPSPSDLVALLAEVSRSGRDAFAIVERRAYRAARSGEHYLQAVRHGAGWAVEVRAGGADRHFRASVEDDQVADVFVSWVENSRHWHTVHWQHVGRPAQLAPAQLAGAV
jgi:hypothetical protein